ncbi:MAG: insulinase family protein, partial [Cyanobacteria bacterium]|nr:insulinase family protein [Cyanobacteriota bacterium]
SVDEQKVSAGETHVYSDAEGADSAGKPAGGTRESDAGTKLSAKTTPPSAEAMREKRPIREITIGRKVQKQVLDSGLTLLVLPVPGSGMVAVSGKLLAGDFFAPPDKTQAAFLAAESVTKGSSKYTKETLANALENMGCELEFYSSTFIIEFDSEVVKQDLTKLVDIVADVLTKPTFPAKELQLEKKLRESDLREDMSDTGEMTWNHLLSNLYKPDRGFYEKSFPEQIAELTSIKRKDIIDFHRSNYTPGNTVLVFVGDTTMDEVKSLCEKNFSGWVGRERNNISVSSGDTNPIQVGKDVVIPLPDKQNVDVRIGKAVPVSIHSKDYFAAVLANAALGYDSFATRLAPVRDEYGLTYGISSAFEDPTQAFAPWTIKYSVNPKNLARARTLVKKIVDDYLKDGITEAEIEREKGHLSGVFSVLLKSSKDIATRLSTYEIAGIPSTYVDEYPNRIRAVSKTDVDKAIRELFDISSAVTVISGTLAEANSSTEEKKTTTDR